MEKRKTNCMKRILSLTMAVILALSCVFPAAAKSFSGVTAWKANGKDYVNAGGHLVIYNRYLLYTDACPTGVLQDTGANCNNCGVLDPDSLTVLGVSGTEELGFPMSLSSEMGQGEWETGTGLMPVFDAYHESKRKEVLRNASDPSTDSKIISGYDGIDRYTDELASDLMAAAMAVGYGLNAEKSTAAEKADVNKAAHAVLINLFLGEVWLASDGGLYGEPLFTESEAVNKAMSELFHRVELWNEAADWGSKTAQAPTGERAVSEYGYDTDFNLVPDLKNSSVSYKNSNWRVAHCTDGNGSNDEQVYLSRGSNKIVWKTKTESFISLETDSANKGISDSNASYTLNGAVYGIYEDEECTKAQEKLVTDEYGKTQTVSVEAGTYYIREISASEGYALNPETYEITVADKERRTVQASETPKHNPVTLLLEKKDSRAGDGISCDSMSLENAEYALDFYGGQYSSVKEAEESGTPLRSWSFKTDQDGKITLSGENLFHSENGEPTLPLGTLLIYETHAPEGYTLDQTKYLVRIQSGTGTEELLRSFEPVMVSETPILGGVMIHMQDSLSEDTPQGDASFAGAEFSVINDGETAVIVDGKKYAPGEVCLTISADESGLAQSAADALPYGDYTLKETKAPEGYGLNEKWSSDFSITQDGKIVDLGIVSHQVLTGTIQVQKLDSDSRKPLCGAEITVVNRSANAIVYEGRIIEPRSDTFDRADSSAEGIVKRMQTDENGLGELRDLPFGTYELVETKAPTGYLINESWNPLIAVHEEETILLEGENALTDSVRRADISFKKINGKTGESLPGVVFKVTNADTAEWHLLITDSEGCFDSRNHDEVNTNDAALNTEGTLNESLLNAGAGIHFGSEEDENAFPYGNYLFEELRCETNEGLSLLSFKVLLGATDDFTDLGTLVDDEPETIKTVLTEKNSGLHVAEAKSGVELIDAISYSGLDISKFYELHGVLMNAETGKELILGGNLVESYLSFQPETSSGSVELTYSLDASELARKNFVSFVTLSTDGVQVAAEKDMGNADQTIHFPGISTLATSQDGEKTVLVDSMGENAVIIDTVSFSNLIPGETYSLSGILRDQSSGGVIRREDGEAYVVETSFVAGAEQGSIKQAFSLPGRQLAGKNLVVSETLLCGSTTIAVHDSLEDLNQTVECRCRCRIFKYDGANHEPLAGAVFTVTDVTDSGRTRQTITSDETGYAVFAGIPGHSYILQETRSPAGYLLDDEELYAVSVLEDGTLEGDVEIPNAQGGTVILSKTDVISSKPLPGCEITVYDAEHKVLFTQKTDERGRIYVSGLLPGIYYYRETASCDGYYLNEDEYSFEISKEQLVSGTVHIENVPYGTAVLKKTDKAGNPLSGAQIAVYSSDGTLLGRGVSEANGRVYFVSPGPGSYYAVEEAAPTGYTLNTAKHEFTIDEDYTISGSLTFVNTRQSGNVSTGDRSGTIGNLLGLVMSGMGAFGIYLLLKKKHASECRNGN